VRLQNLEVDPQNSINFLQSSHESLLLSADADFFYKIKSLLFFFRQLVSTLFGAFRTNGEMYGKNGFKEIIEQLRFYIDVGSLEEGKVQ
jgi:hypothetical protein